MFVVLGSGPGASSGHAAEQRAPSNNESAGLLGGRFNASSTIPVHGAGPWVIVETPTRHHPRRRGRPIPRRLLLGWSERVRIRQRLRAHICAGSGRTPGATPKSNADTTQGDSTRVLRKPASFCAPTRLFRLLAPASRKNLKPHCLRGAFRCVPPRKHLKPCCVRSGKPCTYLAGQLQR